tara:strand:- start:191 stop:484 length:294 start_codon:yes stop_codon:yes gene_type:complete
MWVCNKCNEKHDDVFDMCWKCEENNDNIIRVNIFDKLNDGTLGLSDIEIELKHLNNQLDFFKQRKRESDFLTRTSWDDIIYKIEEEIKLLDLKKENK